MLGNQPASFGKGVTEKGWKVPRRCPTSFGGEDAETGVSKGARTRCVLTQCLQERRDAYRMAGKRLNYYDQANQLHDIKDIREEYRDIYSQVLQDVLRKADKAFKAFFAGCKRGKTPGYPRYKGYHHFDSFTYPQGGYSLTHDHRVCLSKIGSIKVKLHREIKGSIKTCTIKREGVNWYVVFTCEVEQEPLPMSDEAAGIDLGLLHFATLSDGSTIENPRYFRKGEKKLATLQQSLARKKRGSHRRKKVVQQVGKAHRTNEPTFCIKPLTRLSMPMA